jgi:hypothetical protein
MKVRVGNCRHCGSFTKTKREHECIGRCLVRYHKEQGRNQALSKVARDNHKQQQRDSAHVGPTLTVYLMSVVTDDTCDMGWKMAPKEVLGQVAYVSANVRQIWNSGDHVGKCLIVNEYMHCMACNRVYLRARTFYCLNHDANEGLSVHDPGKSYPANKAWLELRSRSNETLLAGDNVCIDENHSRSVAWLAIAGPCERCFRMTSRGSTSPKSDNNWTDAATVTEFSSM